MACSLLGAKKMGAANGPVALIILLTCIGWILNGIAEGAPVPVIDRDIKKTEIEKDIIIQGRDKSKTETFERTETARVENAPELILPEFVINELNEDWNKTRHNNRNNFTQSDLHYNGTVVVEFEYQPELTIRCGGRGTPRPNVTWVYNGGNLPLFVKEIGLTFSHNQSNGVNKEMEDVSWVDLRLPKLNNAFYGRLECVVENSFGNATWEMNLIPNANSSVFMKIVRCTFAAVFILVGFLLIKTVVWLNFKRNEQLYEKLPPQDQEIINKFRKGLPPPPPSPSSSIVTSGVNCVAAAIEITVTREDEGSASSPSKYGYRLVKHGSSSPDLEKRFKSIGNGRSDGTSTPTSCLSVHVLDSVNSWTNFVAYDDKFETSSQHFKVDLTKTIENGVYGMVFLGKVRNDLTMEWSTVTVKTGKSERDDNFMLESILTELKILASLPKAHEHVMNLRGAYTKLLHKRQVYVFVDYCENGCLADFIDLNQSHFIDLFSEPTASALQEIRKAGGSIPTGEDTGLMMIAKPTHADTAEANNPEEIQKKPLQFSTKELIVWARQIADGMRFLHKNKVIHGNLSTANVYVTGTLKVKIGNIGYPPAEESLDCIDATTKKWLTIPDYCYEQFSKKSDVWDYGKTLWEIFSLRRQQCPEVQHIHDFLLKDHGELEMPDFASSEIFEIILCCWNDDGTFRPEFDFFAKVFRNLHKVMFTPAVAEQGTMEVVSKNVLTN